MPATAVGRPMASHRWSHRISVSAIAQRGTARPWRRRRAAEATKTHIRLAWDRITAHPERSEGGCCMGDNPSWRVSGEYFENCSCDVVCPCEISPKGFLMADPDNGYCNVWLA